MTKPLLNSRIIDKGASKEVRVSVAPQFYEESGELKEIDLNFKDLTVSCPTYTATAFDIGVTYQSSRGQVTIKLLDHTGTPTITGNTITWDIAPDTKIQLVAKLQGVEFFKLINSPQGLHTFNWEITGNTEMFLGMTEGKDAEKRNLEVVSERTETNGKVLYSETITGRVSKRFDPKTRIKKYTNEITYPLKVDVAVNEVITVNNDDGQESLTYTNWNARTGANVTWYTGNFGGTAIYNGGVRFQTVAIPQGSTINSATLTINLVVEIGTPTATIYGDDVDSAAAWSNTSRPSQITQTTASASFAPSGTGDKTIDVASIVQEIVNRAGWVSGNDMRFGVISTSAAYSYFSAYDFNVGSTALSARLDIDYTSGGTTNLLTLLGVG